MSKSKPHSSRSRRGRTTSRAAKSMSDGEVLPSDQQDARKAAPRIGPLHDIDAIRREMGRCYREARRREIDTREAARLIYMLGEIRKCYEVSVLERRLTELESQHGHES